MSEEASTFEKEADEIVVDKKENTKFSGVDMVWVLKVR